MEIQNILIFVLLGAVCMVIVTGGALSMSSDDAPSPTSLAGGAAVGGRSRCGPAAGAAEVNADAPAAGADTGLSMICTPPAWRNRCKMGASAVWLSAAEAASDAEAAAEAAARGLGRGVIRG